MRTGGRYAEAGKFSDCMEGSVTNTRWPAPAKAVPERELRRFPRERTSVRDL
jgi:hypothetical protein